MVDLGLKMHGKYGRRADRLMLVVMLIGGCLFGWAAPLAGGDFWDIAVDASGGLLYAIDADGVALLRANWSSSDPLGSLSWQSLATEADWDLLAGLPRVDVVEHPMGSGTFAPWALFDLGSYVRGALFVGNPGSVQAIDHDEDSLGTTSVEHPAIHWETMSEGSQSLLVLGSALSNVEVVDVLTDTVIGSALIPSGAAEATVSLSQSLQIGKWYAARISGTSTDPSRSHYCVRRYGVPGTTPDGSRLHSIPAPYDMWIGNASLLLDIQIDAAILQNEPEDISLIAIIGLAFRDPNGGDPIIWTPIGPSIDPAAAVLLEVQGHVDVSGLGIAYMSLVIPNDPALQGMALLSQFAYENASGVALSEVVVTQIR